MKDFYSRPLNENAFGKSPMQFVDDDVHNCLAMIQEIALIENGSPEAREKWQSKQLANLFEHAKQYSKFWRSRMPSRRMTGEQIKFIPPLTREDLAQQIKSEGSLTHEPDGSKTQTYETTGSTGMPVTAYVTKANGHYNAIRSLAENMIKNLPFTENYVRISAGSTKDPGVKVKETPVWAPPLSKLFQNGKGKSVTYDYDVTRLVAELSKDRVGYMRCSSNVVDQLYQYGGTEIFKTLGVYAWIHVGDSKDPQMVAELRAVGIPTYSSYSSGELGPIGLSCPHSDDHYHVATSNVVVEADPQLTVTLADKTLSRLLITGLHSYATPLIRYDIGDFGILEPSCPCGHTGPTLSHLYGRRKHFVRHRDGRMIAFTGRSHELLRGLEFKDSRIRQTGLDELTFEIAGASNMDDQLAALIQTRVKKIVGTDFSIVLKLSDEIDWQDSPKRLFFTNLSGGA